MSALSRYLRSVAGGGLTFWCQGCNEAHTVWVGAGPGPRWTWNGDAEKPVFGPSVLVKGHDFTPKGRADYEAWLTLPDGERPRHPDGFTYDRAETVCHTFVGCNGAQPGEIIFLGDCTHALAGKTVPLAEMPPYMYRDEDVS